MDNQRIVGWTPLGSEYFPDRSRIRGVRSQAVNGLGRDRHKPSSSYDRGSFSDHRFVDIGGINLTHLHRVELSPAVDES